MKKHLLTLLFLYALPLSISAQCKYQPYLEVSSLPSNSIGFDPSTTTTETYYAPISEIKSYADSVFLAAEGYITQRGGTAFFQKLKPTLLLVLYDTDEDVDSKDKRFYEISKYPVTYELYYSYKNQGESYDFTISLSEDLAITSEPAFPDISVNKNFETLITPCAAIAKVKALPKFKGKKVGTLRLGYNGEADAFCWSIAEDFSNSLPGMHDYTINVYDIDATTGKLLETWQSSGTLVNPEAEPVTPKKKKSKARPKKKK